MIDLKISVNATRNRLQSAGADQEKSATALAKMYYL
jgi:hypothetical protein